MPDQQRRSWHQPEVTNLSPDSYTAQKLVCMATDYARRQAKNSRNMRQLNICTSPRGATSSVLSRYASPNSLSGHGSHTSRQHG
jgi:hypothetical protein